MQPWQGSNNHWTHEWILGLFHVWVPPDTLILSLHFCTAWKIICRQAQKCKNQNWKWKVQNYTKILTPNWSSILHKFCKFSKIWTIQLQPFLNATSPSSMQKPTYHRLIWVIFEQQRYTKQEEIGNSCFFYLLPN